MPAPKRPHPAAKSDSILAQLSERPQLEFEMELFEALLEKVPDFTEVLNAQAGNFAAAGRFADGLKVAERIVRLRPRDSAAYYSLACRYAQLKQRDMAFSALRKAVELGYRDFRTMSRDNDLASLRKDPRFRQLLREFAANA